MLKLTRRRVTFVGLLLGIVVWVIALTVYGPTVIIQKVGTNHGYALAFLMAFIGSVTFLTTITIYPALVTFALGGLNPYILIMVSALGLTLGDLFFYYFGYTARGFVAERTKKTFARFMSWLEKAPSGLFPFFFYLYIGFTPLPNNLLAASLALTGYPMRRFVLPDFLGNITLPVIVVYLARQGVRLFG